MTAIEIDGSRGEGGGQVLRSALALSLVTGTPFRMTNVRAGRKRPGLMRQHLTAVMAAAEVGGASVTGAEIVRSLNIYQYHKKISEIRPSSRSPLIGSTKVPILRW